MTNQHDHDDATSPGERRRSLASSIVGRITGMHKLSVRPAPRSVSPQRRSSPAVSPATPSTPEDTAPGKPRLEEKRLMSRKPTARADSTDSSSSAQEQEIVRLRYELAELRQALSAADADVQAERAARETERALFSAGSRHPSMPAFAHMSSGSGKPLSKGSSSSSHAPPQSSLGAGAAKLPPDEGEFAEERSAARRRHRSYDTDALHLRAMMDRATKEAQNFSTSEPASPRNARRQRRQRRELELEELKRSGVSFAAGGGSTAASPARMRRHPPGSRDATPALRARFPSVPRYMSGIPVEPSIGTVKFGEVDMLRPLGCGSLGVVLLARHEKTRMLYAIKAVPKAMLTASGDTKRVSAAIRRLKRERDGMYALEGHPSVLRLHGVAADEYFVYLITEACMGGELFRLADAITPMPPSDTAFYTGAVLLALSAAHSRAIAHRDIKLENILIDGSGWPRLADWGACVHVGGGGRGRTRTRIGTLEYMAPELCRGDQRGHGLAADWWSFGCLVFELLVGRTPCAYPPSASDVDILRNIIAGKVIWPTRHEPKLPEDAVELLKKLLVLDDETRLGAPTPEGGGPEAVRSHVFFDRVDLDAIANRAAGNPRATPPWVPPLRTDADNSFAPEGAETAVVDLCSSMSSTRVRRAQVEKALNKARALAPPYDPNRWEEYFEEFADVDDSDWMNSASEPRGSLVPSAGAGAGAGASPLSTSLKESDADHF